MDSYEDYQFNNNDYLDNKHYENFFALQPRHDIELDISINEDHINSPMTNAFTKETSNKDIKSYISNNSTVIELKRKKNREASRISRQKKKEDIISLVKTNEQLKVKIKELNQLLDNNICAECKRAINSPLGSQLNLKEALSKNSNTRTISTTSISSSPIQAKTAMFISMVVVFCIIVNSFSDKNRNYLRKVTINNTFNDYFNTIEINNSEDSINMTKCIDYLKYYYSLYAKVKHKNDNEQYIAVNIAQQRRLVNEETKSNTLSNKCQSIFISQNAKGDENDDHNNNNNTPIHLAINVDKQFLIRKIFQENNSFQEDPNNSNYIQLDCLIVYLNTSTR